MVGRGITHLLSQHGEVETVYPPWGSLESQQGLFGEFQVKEDGIRGIIPTSAINP